MVVYENTHGRKLGGAMSGFPNLDNSQSEA